MLCESEVRCSALLGMGWLGDAILEAYASCLEVLDRLENGIRVEDGFKLSVCALAGIARGEIIAGYSYFGRPEPLVVLKPSGTSYTVEPARPIPRFARRYAAILTRCLGGRIPRTYVAQVLSACLLLANRELYKSSEPTPIEAIIAYTILDGYVVKAYDDGGLSITDKNGLSRLIVDPVASGRQGKGRIVGFTALRRDSFGTVEYRGGVSLYQALGFKTLCAI